jgi:hypothetical protein
MNDLVNLDNCNEQVKVKFIGPALNFRDTVTFFPGVSQKSRVFTLSKTNFGIKRSHWQEEKSMKMFYRTKLRETPLVLGGLIEKKHILTGLKEVSRGSGTLSMILRCPKTSYFRLRWANKNSLPGMFPSDVTIQAIYLEAASIHLLNRCLKPIDMVCNLGYQNWKRPCFAKRVS